MPVRKKITWVLVGDGVKAQLYTFHAIPLRLKPVPSGRFRSGKARTSELESDQAAGTFNSLSGARHAIERQADGHQRQEDKFVARVAAAVNKAATARKFDDLILIAPPRALAAFRKQLDATTIAKVKRQIRGEWAQLGIKEIETHLAARLAR